MSLQQGVAFHIAAEGKTSCHSHRHPTRAGMNIKGLPTLRGTAAERWHASRSRLDARAAW